MQRNEVWCGLARNWRRDLRIWKRLGTSFVYLELVLALVVSAANAQTALSSRVDAWGQLGQGAQHTSQAWSSVGLVGGINWSASAGGFMMSSAVVSRAGTVYVGSDNMTLYALGTDGSVRWSKFLFGPIFKSPAIAPDGTIYATSELGALHALDPESGNILWSHYTFLSMTAPVVGSDGTVYFGASDAGLHAVNPDGSVKWRYQAYGPIVAEPAIGSDGTIYAASSYLHRLHAINPDGTLKWVREAGLPVLPITSAPTIAKDGTIYLGVNSSLKSFGSDGSYGFVYTVGGHVAAAPSLARTGTLYGNSYQGNTVVFTAKDGYVYSIEDHGQSAVKQWKKLIGWDLRSSPTVGTNGRLFVSSDNFKVVALNQADGSKLWEQATQSRIYNAPVAGLDGALYVGTSLGKVLSIGRGLIASITLSKDSVCAGEPFEVQVDTGSATSKVYIDGTPGAVQQLQLNGNPGTRHVVVIVEDGTFEESRVLPVELTDCATTRPVIVATAAFDTPYTVEFLVTNAQDFPGTDRVFSWDFGDGTVLESEYPYLKHSYAEAIDANTVDLAFEVAVTVRRTGSADLVGERTVTMHNLYASAKRDGIWQPPVSYDPLMTTWGPNYWAQYSIRNLEGEPVVFTEQTIEARPCDPDLEPSVRKQFSVSMQINAYETRTMSFYVPQAFYGSDICGVDMYLAGTAPNGDRLRTSVYFDLPHSGFFSSEVPAGQIRDLLNDVASQGLVADPNRITAEELRTLYIQGRIPSLPTRDGVDTGALQSSSDPIGQPCNPSDTPPRIGITCQATDDWTVTAPSIRNARKGDLFAVAGCGIVSKVLSNVKPKQNYPHIGIMTRNYYALTQSTCSMEFVMSEIEDGLVLNWNSEYLQYCWPGVVHDSVDTAINGQLMTSPEGTQERIRQFNPGVQECEEGHAVAPVIVKPEPGSPASVRDILHAAADVASQRSGHYRLYVYTEATAMEDPNKKPSSSDVPWGTQPGVCSGFVWDVLKQVGATLEGDESACASDPTACLEQGDVRRRTDVDPTSVGHPGTYRDGLYFYTSEERTSSGNALWTYVHDKAKERLWAIGGAVGNIVADEIIGCFGADQCSIDTALNSSLAEDLLKSAGPGQAVSPDDIIYLWDGPSTGGVYGYREPVSYADAFYQRVHRWAASSGTGSLSGSVDLDGMLITDGSATVELLASCSGSACASNALLDAVPDANGEFSLTGIPAGSYVARASLPYDTDGDTIKETTLVTDELVQIAVGQDTQVSLSLTTGTTAPPPPFDMDHHSVRISGNIHLVDWDCCSPNDIRDFTLAEKRCDVSPAKRIDWVEWGQDESLCSDEVWSTVFVRCELDANDVDVHVTVEQAFYEWNTCGDEDLDGRGSITLGPIAPGNSASGQLTTHSNEDPDDYGRVDITADHVKEGTVSFDPSDTVRGIFLQGQVTIIDDESVADDEERIQLWEVFVDLNPGTHHAEVHSFCVGDEVIATLYAECWRGGSDVACELNYRVWEGDDCVTDSGDETSEKTFHIAFPLANANGFGEGLATYQDIDVGGHAIVRYELRNYKILWSTPGP